MEMKTYEIEIQLDFSPVVVEIQADENADENELYFLAITEIERQLNYSKLNSYRVVC